MNFVILICVALTSFLLGVGAESVKEHNSSKIKVGDCVRQLGDDVIETVTYVTDTGTLETKFNYQYSDGTKGYEYRHVFSEDASKRLIKMECK